MHIQHTTEYTIQVMHINRAHTKRSPAVKWNCSFRNFFFFMYGEWCYLNKDDSSDKTTA